MEAIVIILILADVCLVAIETGIDHHLLCINGEVVDVPPHDLKAFGRPSAADLHSPTGSPITGGGPDMGPIHHSTPRAFLLRREHQERPLPGEQTTRRQQELRTQHLKEDGGHDHGHQERSLVCEDRKGHNAHHLAHQCHFWSVIILWLFLAELITKLWVNPHHFIHDKFHMLDLTVVVLSLIIDIVVIEIIMTLQGGELTQTEIEWVAILLIVCRFWRIVRIVHGAFETVHHEIKKQNELQAEIDLQKLEIQRLKRKS